MSEEPIDYEIHFNEDGTQKIVLHLDSIISAVDASRVVRQIRLNMKLDDLISKIRNACKSKKNLLIFPITKGVSNEVRLVASVAAHYPDGFPQDAILSELGISNTSKDAYINWDTKTSSRYLRYDPQTKRVNIIPQGIDWVCKELGKRGVSGFP
jgi:hypothetical protein